jgi:hypothetical protein
MWRSGHTTIKAVVVDLREMDERRREVAALLSCCCSCVVEKRTENWHEKQR